MEQDVRALIAKARVDAADIRDMEHESYHWAAGMLDRLADALEAATASPAVAVDASKLRGALANVLSNVTNYPESVQSRMLGQHTGALIEKVASAVEGMARDVRDVQAETLEEAAADLPSMAGWNAQEADTIHLAQKRLRARAQAIREARDD